MLIAVKENAPMALRTAPRIFLSTVLTHLVGTRDYNGAGSAVIHAAIGGQARPDAFRLKMFFTTVNLGAAVGMVAVFCSVTNGPISSILLAAELFGGRGLPLFALASAVSYMLSGYIGLYTEQEIVYSKPKPILNDWKNWDLP